MIYHINLFILFTKPGKVSYFNRSAKMKEKFNLNYGYIIVIAGFIIMVLILGGHYTYGVFFKPIISEYGWTRATTAGAFSLAWFLSGISGIGLGALNDKIGPRIVLTLCGVLTGISFILMSRIEEVWQLYVIYGLLFGIGMGIFVPLTSTVAGWFDRRRTLMTGIVVAGIGIGTIIGPPVASRLILAYDWRESYFILGGVLFIVVILMAQFLKRNPSHTIQKIDSEKDIHKQELLSEKSWFNLKEALTTSQFWLMFSQFVCFGFCQSFIIVHIVPHTTDLGISSNEAANILSTIGAFSIIGKVAMGAVGDIIGNKKAFILAFVIALISLVWILFTRSLPGFYLFAAMFGIAYGTHISQQSPMAASLFGLQEHGTIFGVLAFGMAVGATAGPIITGYLYDLTSNYNLAIMLSIILSIIGLFLTAIVKITIYSKKTK